ncbi:MAG: PKD domain-containing protein [Dehalococcoidales bacterium]|nr:PKD domain-containing protein [Dehalococcoidales bacterium]
MISKRNIINALIFTLSLLLILAATACNGSNTAKPEPEVITPQEPANDAPVIAGLLADQQVQPLGTTQVTCDANDADGDAITYRWTASGGTISGEGSAVSWTAPEKTGSYLIKVVVSDGKGGVSTKDFVVTVPEKPNNPPIIEGITFQWSGHMPTTIKPAMTEKDKDRNPDPVIRIWETADIACTASDPDNDKLDYIWMANAGTINSVPGKPDSVQWIAPGAGGTYSVTCEVSDPDGLTATFTIMITVKCCGIY